MSVDWHSERFTSEEYDPYTTTLVHKQMALDHAYSQARAYIEEEGLDPSSVQINGHFVEARNEGIAVVYVTHPS